MTQTNSSSFTSGHATVNGLRMYYEIYGEGKPLVLLHGGGSTIQTSFGRIIPMLAKNHQVVGIELQAHGRTGDRDTEISFEQDADDVAALLDHLHIPRADIMGFSNGGTTALQLAIRHPSKVDHLIVASALTKRNGAPDAFWQFMNHADITHMPQAYKDEYTKVAPDPAHLQVMHDKCAARMRNFRDIPDQLVRSIQAPTLIVNADADVGTPEHAVEMHRIIKGSRLAILPGGHGDYIGEITTLKPTTDTATFIVPMIENFLSNNP